jgi:hypothetical protein
MEEKINEIVDLIWLTSGFGMTQLLKQEEFAKLNFETVAKISTETTLFLLNICDRQIFLMVGDKKRNDIVTRVLEAIFKKLEKHDDMVLKKFYGERSNENQNQYFNYLSKSGFSVGFREIYNERQIEYSKYKKFFPEKDEPFKDTLVWEFGKKINLIAMGYPHLVVTTSICMLASDMIITCVKSLKLILKNDNKNENKSEIKSYEQALLRALIRGSILGAAVFNPFNIYIKIAIGLFGFYLYGVIASMERFQRKL